MQPKLCVKCKKNIAVVFISKIENGTTLNEGYCLKCAKSLGIPQLNDVVRQMGISEEDLDMLSDEMSNMFAQLDAGDDADDDEVDSQTATFPLLNQLFGSSDVAPKNEPNLPEISADRPEGEEEKKQGKSFSRRRKWLALLCVMEGSK